MLKSAQNFAAGFFGIPAEDQFNLEVMIESKGFNNTLAPWNTVSEADGHLPSSTWPGEPRTCVVASLI
jgi:hypothetical protein